MKGHGKLTIEAGNALLDDNYALQHPDVRPGQYVMMAVTDTGIGMSPEVMEHVFEPFFTTKPEGQGTGLGLSMVYGFVKQSDGHIKLYSEPGHGTTIRLYLPRVRQVEDVVMELDGGPITGGTETILVVEDDEDVRNTVVETLSDLGYRVLKAKDAQSAFAIIESGAAVDLLFTDVVMPGPMRSPELAKKSRERVPTIAVLFTSGYTDNAIVHGGRLDAGIDLLSKPYTREALARKIRHVLRNQQQQNAIAQSKAENSPPWASPVTAASLPVWRILLVEDNDAVRAATADMLTDMGHSVIDAATAEAALASLIEQPADILLTDISLQSGSGIELAKEALRLMPALRIIFASGENALQELPEQDQLIAAIFVAKPFGEKNLLEALSSLQLPRL